MRSDAPTRLTISSGRWKRSCFAVWNTSTSCSSFNRSQIQLTVTNRPLCRRPSLYQTTYAEQSTKYCRYSGGGDCGTAQSNCLRSKCHRFHTQLSVTNRRTYTNEWYTTTRHHTEHRTESNRNRRPAYVCVPRGWLFVWTSRYIMCSLLLSHCI